MRRPLALATTAATALLLTTACTGGGGEAAPTSSGSPSASAAQEQPAEDAPAGASAECILGTWDMDTAALEESMAQLFALGGDETSSMDMTITGTGTYEFAEGGAFSTTSDMTSGVTISAEGMEIVTEGTSTGTMTGTWALEGDQLTLSDLDTSALTVTTTGTMNGEEIAIPEGSAEGAIQAAPPAASTVSCTEDTLTLTTTSAVDESSEPLSISYTLRR